MEMKQYQNRLKCDSFSPKGFSAEPVEALVCTAEFCFLLHRKINKLLFCANSSLDSLDICLLGEKPEQRKYVHSVRDNNGSIRLHKNIEFLVRGFERSVLKTGKYQEYKWFHGNADNWVCPTINHLLTVITQDFRKKSLCQPDRIGKGKKVNRLQLLRKQQDFS